MLKKGGVEEKKIMMEERIGEEVEETGSDRASSGRRPHKENVAECDL